MSILTDLRLIKTVPKDFTAEEEQAFEEERSRRASRRGSSLIPEEFMDSFSPRRSNSVDRLSRRASSPGQSPPPMPFHRRTGSTSTPPTAGSPMHSTVGSPAPTSTSLSFNLPRTDTRGRSSMHSGRSQQVTGGVTSGQLSPVRESGLSREPTMVRQPEGER